MRRLTPVRVSDHALERYRERVRPISRHQLGKEIRLHLLAHLGTGARVIDEAIFVEVHPGIVAVAYASLLGGWEVSTVMEVGA